MALTVQTNTAAITALKHLNTNSVNMGKSLERLSSGFRVNSAADDAAGYAIASKLDAQTARLKAATQNVSQAQAMVKMADAGVNEIQNMIVRVETLAIQASSANNGGELNKLDAERTKLESQINKIASSTNYNGLNLLNGADATVNFTTAFTAGGPADTGVTTASVVTASGSQVNNVYTLTSDAAGDLTISSTGGGSGTLAFSASTTNTVLLTDGATLSVDFAAAPLGGVGTNTVTVSQQGIGTVGTSSGATYQTALAFQAGADNNVDNRVTVDLTNSYTTASLGLGVGDLLSQTNAQSYINTAKSALDTLVTQRADLGATQNQLSFVAANLATSIEQATASVSSIRDADMALEMAEFTKNQILVQASTSMLAQANQAAQNVLSLFR